MDMPEFVTTQPQSVITEEAPAEREWIPEDFVSFSVNSASLNFGFNDYNISGGTLRDEVTGDIDVYRTLIKPWNFPETAFFSEYRKLLFDNSIFSVLVKFLMDEIAGSSYYFDGDDEEKVRLVEDFWYRNNLYEQLEEVVLQGIGFGTGVGVINKSKGSPVGFRRLDVTTIRLDRDKKSGKITIYQDTTNITNNAFFLRFFKYPDTPWGISLVRPLLSSVQALDQLFRDIPPAIKQLAYVDRIVKLDVSKIKDPAQRRTIMRNAKAAWANYDAATTTVVVMGKDVQFGYAGTVDGSAGGQKRLDPIMPLIVPIIMFVLLQFNVAPGEVVQDGANKAIIREQRALAKKRIESLRAKFAYEVERQIIAPLLKEEGMPSVRLLYKPDPLPPDEESRIMMEGYQNGVFSMEEVRSKHGFKRNRKGTMIWDKPITRREVSVRLNDEMEEEQLDKLSGNREVVEVIDEGEQNDE